MWLRDRPVALIADATGSGKTAVAAAAIADAFDHEGSERAVWVTEANLISQALRELRRFLPILRISGWPGVRTIRSHVRALLRVDVDVVN